MFAQTGEVTGQVIDAGTDAPLAGVTVRVLDAGVGAVTDTAGRFAISGVAAGTWRVRFDLVGYDPVVRTDVVVTTSRAATLVVKMRSAVIQGREVVVRPEYFDRGTERDVTRATTLSNEEIRRLPGGFEDVVRAVSILPGVAQSDGGRNDLIVRGGAPSENLYLIDNIEAPNINHFGTQGAGGGPLSFVNLDFVRDVSFSAGGFGVQYGNRLSSVVDIDLRDGRRDGLGGRATISATQFGLDFEGPITERGTFIASARRSYLDLIFRAAGFAFVPEYWDFLGRTSWNLGGDDRLSALVIGAIDRVRQFNDNADDRFENSRILDNSQNQIVAGVTWRHLFDIGYTTTTLRRTLVDYRFRQTDSLGVPVFTNTSTEDEIGLRSDVVLQLGDRTELSFGAEATTAGFDGVITLDQPGVSVDVDAADRFTRAAVYAQATRRLFETLRLTLGGRLDYFSGIDRTLYPALRMTLAQPIGELTTLSLSAGRYFQAPSYVWLVANDVNRSLRSIRSDAVVLGLERLLAEDIRATLEGYVKRYDDYPASRTRPYLVLANTGAGFGGADEGFASFGLDPLVSDGTGRSWGAELLIQKKPSEIPLYGIVAISLNWSRFTALDGVERPGNYDQRLIANLSAGYRFGTEWEVGMKFRFASGRPYTPVDSTGDPTYGYRDVSQINALRLGAQHALDVRVDRRWNFGRWSLVTYIDVQNVYNHRNPSPPRYNARTRTAEVSESLGILPSIGVTLEAAM